MLNFSGGIVKIPFTELSPEIQKKYGYDPKAAGDFQQQTYQKRGLSTKYYEQLRKAVNVTCDYLRLKKSRRLITSNCLRGDMLAALESIMPGKLWRQRFSGKPARKKLTTFELARLLVGD